MHTNNKHTQIYTETQQQTNRHTQTDRWTKTETDTTHIHTNM